MPIEKINADGTINIISNDGSKKRTVTADEWTRDYGKPLPIDYDNQVKQAKQQSLIVPSGQLPSTGVNPYQDKIDKIKQQKEQMNSGTQVMQSTPKMQSTQTQPTDNIESLRQSYRQAAESDPANANYYFDQFKSRTGVGIDEPSKSTVSDADKKKQDALKSADDILTRIEDNYYKYQLAGGRLGGVVSTIQSKLGQNPELNQYNSFLKAIRPKLARAMGDVGNLSAPEQAAAIADIPNQFNTPEEAKLFFEGMRLRMGLPERTTPAGSSGTPIKKYFEPILSESRKVAQDIGVGLVNKDKLNQSQQNALALAQKAEQKAKEVEKTNPEQAKKLMKIAQDTYQTLSGISGEQAGLYSSSVQKNPLERGLETGVEVGLTADVVSSLPSIPSKLKELPKTLNIRGNIAAKRTAAAEAVNKTKIAGKTFKDAITSEAEKMATPQAQKAAKELLPSIPKNIKPSELLDKLDFWNTAFTESGKVGATEKKRIFAALAREARKQLQEKAPEVMKYQKQLGLTRAIPKAIKQAAYYAGIPASVYYGLKSVKNMSEGE